MSEKMTCPGCGAHTSSVLADFRDEEPCRYCGLPHEAAVAVKSARASSADKTLIAQYEAAIIRATRAEAALVEYQRIIEDIRHGLAGLGGA